MRIQQKKQRPGWYVVQVTPGIEGRICDAIKRACRDLDERIEDESERTGLKDCFSPKFASRKKRMGQWYNTERALLPGYVVADVKNPAALARALRGVNDFCRVLASDETYSPLDETERTWFEAHSDDDTRTIPLSFGYREGTDTIVVSSGPLKGREATIKKIDRKNCMAHVEFHAGPITFKATVGLVIDPHPDGASNATRS